MSLGRRSRRTARLTSLASAIVLPTPGPARAQSPAEVVGWVRDHAHPVDSLGEGIGGLAERVAGARVIGVGESVHDQHEFLAFRARLLRELVLRHQITAVALESGLPEAIALDRYVSGQTDRVDWSAAMTYGFGDFTETRAAFEWLRRQNAEPGRRTVHVYGIDLPGSAGSLVPAIDWLLEYLGPIDASLARSVRAGLLPIARRITGPYWRPAAARYDSLPPAARDSLRSGIEAMLSTLRARRTHFVRSGGRDRYDWAVRIAIVCRQAEVMLRRGALDPTNPRDVAMAENTRWVLGREGPEGRVLLWAHNAHVAAVPIEGPASPAGAAAASTGAILRRTLGRAYRSIGTVYDRSAPDSTADPASIDGTLAAAGIDRFWLAVPAEPAVGPVARWLDTSRPIRFQGIGYLDLVPRKAFDFLVYFSTIRPATRGPDSK